MGKRAGLGSRAEDLERTLVGERLRDQVGHGVGDPRLVWLRLLAWAIGVERTADRVAEPMLVLSRARVDLTRQLREPVRRTGGGTVTQVRFARGELGRSLEHHRGGD